jgi:hypothetical protein
LRSKAILINGTIYKLPSKIGLVDISVFGAILLHLRDPFLALQSALKITKETVVITDLYHEGLMEPPALLFLPDPKTLQPIDTWWYISPEWVKQVLSVLGFGEITGTLHSQKHKSCDKSMFTIVGRRTS